MKKNVLIGLLTVLSTVLFVDISAYRSMINNCLATDYLPPLICHTNYFRIQVCYGCTPGPAWSIPVAPCHCTGEITITIFTYSVPGGGGGIGSTVGLLNVQSGTFQGWNNLYSGTVTVSNGIARTVIFDTNSLPVFTNTVPVSNNCSTNNLYLTLSWDSSVNRFFRLQGQ
jgi:hypothetical protein